MPFARRMSASAGSSHRNVSMQRDRTVTTPDASAKVTPPTERFLASWVEHVRVEQDAEQVRQPSIKLSFSNAVNRTTASVNHGSSVPSASSPNCLNDQ